MKPKFKFMITAEHVRNPHSLGRDFFFLIRAIGRLLPCDVGKRVYDCGDGVYQVENDEQRKRRLNVGRALEHLG